MATICNIILQKSQLSFTLNIQKVSLSSKENIRWFYLESIFEEGVQFGSGYS